MCSKRSLSPYKTLGLKFLVVVDTSKIWGKCPIFPFGGHPVGVESFGSFFNSCQNSCHSTFVLMIWVDAFENIIKLYNMNQHTWYPWFEFQGNYESHDRLFCICIYVDFSCYSFSFSYVFFCYDSLISYCAWLCRYFWLGILLLIVKTLKMSFGIGFPEMTIWCMLFRSVTMLLNSF